MHNIRPVNINKLNRYVPRLSPEAICFAGCIALYISKRDKINNWRDKDSYVSDIVRKYGEEFWIVKSKNTLNFVVEKE